MLQFDVLSEVMRDYVGVLLLNEPGATTPGATTVRLSLTQITDKTQQLREQHSKQAEETMEEHLGVVLVVAHNQGFMSSSF